MHVRKGRELSNERRNYRDREKGETKIMGKVDVRCKLMKKVSGRKKKKT